MLVATSVAAYVVGTRGLGLTPRSLGSALGMMLECVGAIVGFAGLNLAVGVGVVLAARLVTGRFVSLYVVDDYTWLILSVPQALTWWLWVRRR